MTAIWWLVDSDIFQAGARADCGGWGIWASWGML